MDTATHADVPTQTVEEAQADATKPRREGSAGRARRTGNSRTPPQVNKALGLAYWRNRGLLSSMDLYAQDL